VDVAGVKQIHRPEVPQVEKRVAVLDDGVVGFRRLCFFTFTGAMVELPTVTRGATEGDGAAKSGCQTGDGVQQQWQEAEAQ
jgi:hypothetical protein